MLMPSRSHRLVAYAFFALIVAATGFVLLLVAELLFTDGWPIGVAIALLMTPVLLICWGELLSDLRNIHSSNKIRRQIKEHE